MHGDPMAPVKNEYGDNRAARRKLARRLSPRRVARLLKLADRIEHKRAAQGQRKLMRQLNRQDRKQRERRLGVSYFAQLCPDFRQIAERWLTPGRATLS